jgi:copper chaperone CopZ
LWYLGTVCLAGASLGLTDASAAQRPVRKAGVSSRRSAPHRPANPAKAPQRTGPKLSAGARAPKGADAFEKAALEIPELRSQLAVSTVVEALQRLPGVRSAVVDLNTHLAVVDYNPALTELDHFLGACKDAGYEASEYRVESRFPKPIKIKGG